MKLELEFSNLYDMSCIVTLYNLLTKKEDNEGDITADVEYIDVILDEISGVYEYYNELKLSYDGEPFANYVSKVKNV
jgi:hypothetical protein